MLEFVCHDPTVKRPEWACYSLAAMPLAFQAAQQVDCPRMSGEHGLRESLQMVGSVLENAPAVRMVCFDNAAAHERTSPRGVDECSGFVCPFLLWLGVGELPRVNPSQVALPGGTLQRWGDLLHQWASTCYQECSRGIEVACPADFLWQILLLYSTTLWAWCATSKLDGCGLTVGDLAAHLYNQLNQTKYNIIYIYTHIYI